MPVSWPASARHHDSSWVAEVLGDPPLAAAIAEVEDTIRSDAVGAADGRSRPISVIHDRYRDGG